jgi:hypothetical protein
MAVRLSALLSGNALPPKKIFGYSFLIEAE